MNDNSDSQISMDDVIKESFFKKDAPKVPDIKPKAEKRNSALDKAFETYSSLKNEGKRLADVICADRQREVMASRPNPGLVSSLIDPAPVPILKKRGRPRKSDTSSLGSIPTPERSVTFDEPRPILKLKTPPRARTPERQSDDTPSQPKKMDPRYRHNVIVKIQEYIKLYPSLVAKGIAPSLPYDFSSLPDEHIEALYAACKENGSSSNTGKLEYQMVSSTFYKILDNFESLCYFATWLFPQESASLRDTNPILIALKFMSRQPRGSFSTYVHKCILAGDDMDKDLREISIQLIGYLPESPYTRIMLKLAYCAYDYSRFTMDSQLQATMNRANETISSMSKDEMNAFYSMMAQQQ